MAQLTPEEFNALVYLLQRLALTPIESAGVNAILEKIAPKPVAPPANEPTAEPGTP